MSNRGLAAFFSRWALGIFVGMIGVYKLFVLGPAVHAEKFFVQGFTEHWIPQWLLLVLGYTIPYVELLCGLLLLVGLWVRFNVIIIGFLLLVVAYGHMLQDAFYDPTAHWLPRFVLLIAVLLMYDREDRWSLEHVIFDKRSP